jgi:hypothetical protein
MDYRDLLAARDDAQRRVKDLEMTLTLTRERLRIAEQRAAMAEMNASDRVEGCGRAMTYILDRDATDDDDGPGDKWLVCVDCGVDFMFDRDSGEGLIFRQRGWSLPTRCRGCRRQAADRRRRRHA